MKKELREEAIVLRNEGMSIKKIARQLKVSQGTVSLWVRDIELCELQKLKLKSRRGLQRSSSKSRENRKSYQEHGRKLARLGDSFFVGGCMLYWGEGSKTMNASAIMTNSDVDVLIYFISFIKKYYELTSDDFKANINCHLDYGIDYYEVEKFWSDKLGITHFNKPQIKQGCPITKGKHKRLKYGTCRVCVHNVKVVQSIFGGIQEIANISRDEWLG